MPIDYSKWNRIEISDDEDDTHPNIDTPSLFRWRHQARVERMEEQEKEKKSFMNAQANLESERTKLHKELHDIEEKSKNEEKTKELKKKLQQLKIEEEKMNQKKAELEKKERLTPLNIDTICHEGKSKTIINKGDSKPKVEDSADVVDRLQKFVEKNESLIKKFGMFRRPDDSQAFLIEHPHLVCEETANHLVIWCVDLCIEEKTSLMEHVAHQTISMQFILELAKSMKMDPRGCVRPFYRKFKDNDPQYMQGFNDELKAFIQRVHVRAEARVEEAMKKYEEEEREKRLGPGGLDPVEVMESLPESLQKCFESRSMDLLKDVIGSMDPEEAKYHMNRCVESGLWVPGAGAEEEGAEGDQTTGEGGDKDGKQDEDKDEVYEELKD